MRIIPTANGNYLNLDFVSEIRVHNWDKDAYSIIAHTIGDSEKRANNKVFIKRVNTAEKADRFVRDMIAGEFDLPIKTKKHKRWWGLFG